MEPVIRAKNLGKLYKIFDNQSDRLKQLFWRSRRKYYQEFWALKNVSFEIRKGETLGIIGLNGSGKTTLLQLISGILKPTAGEMEIYGKVSALLELGSGFNPDFTGRENVFMSAAIMGMSHQEVINRYDTIVAFADIGDFIDQPVRLYSSGMYIRLAFAAAVNITSEILLVDEALSVGDLRFQQKCMRKMKQFSDNGTIIFVSHDTTAITELCSRVIWLDSGMIQMDGTPKNVIGSYLEVMYKNKGLNEKKTDKESLKVEKNFEIDNKKYTMIDTSAKQFGNQRVTIRAASISSSFSVNGQTYSGHSCKISMILDTHDNINKPIAGFIIKDRLGREIIGDNSALIGHNLSEMTKNNRYEINFQIKCWPNIYEAEYSLTIALADGTWEEHEMCHYVHDVIVFKSVSARTPNGIFSILETEISTALVKKFIIQQE